MGKIINWDNFLNESEVAPSNKRWINSYCWWGVPQGNDETGGMLFTLYPLSEEKPQKGTPADISTIFFDDVDGDFIEFEEGTDEYNECMEKAEEDWERGCQSEIYKRIFFFMTIDDVSPHHSLNGGRTFNEWEPPLPPTVGKFIIEMEARTKHFIFLGATKTGRMRTFITDHFFKTELYKNRDAVHIIQKLDELVGGIGENTGVNLVLDQLKEISDQGTMLDYGFIINLFKQAIPDIESKMGSRGIEMERLTKLDKANKLLKRK